MSLEEKDFMAAFRGSFIAALRWPQLDALWSELQQNGANDWFIYAIGEPPPESPATAQDLQRFLSEMAVFLRREHAEDYCGIVYADRLERPAMIKIYDPHNLGVSCGYSNNPPAAGLGAEQAPSL